MQDRTKPFTVIRDGRAAYVIHAYSAEAARQLVEARTGDADVIIVPVPPRRATSTAEPHRNTDQHGPGINRGRFAFTTTGAS